jgi:hypothetical protein
MNDEFYIGWQEKAPPGVGSRVRGLVIILLGLAVAVGASLALAQQTIGVSVFEWGKIKSFSGILQSQPYPHLLVRRPGVKNGPTSFSSYHLVNPFKFGFDAVTARRFNGQMVTLKGTLIYRAGQTMIEVVEDSTGPAETAEQSLLTNTVAVSLGRQTLIGEIVDSKCYLGVMNPGALTPHRACAIRCISGGIPPVLLVRRTNGPPLYLVLVSPDGQPVNKQVVNLVAEPVEITGEVERQGELLILRADPGTYQRKP